MNLLGMSMCSAKQIRETHPRPKQGQTNTNTNNAMATAKQKPISVIDPDINNTSKYLRGYRVEFETPTKLITLYIHKMGNVFHLPFDQDLLAGIQDKSGLPVREVVSSPFLVNALPSIKDEEAIADYLLRIAKVILYKIGIKIRRGVHSLYLTTA